MGFKDNRDMVFASIAQQGVAALLFLVVPRILGVSNYAQVTYATTLLGFISFADFGLSFVYGRKMPGIYARQDTSEIAVWDSSILRFRLLTSFLFSATISLSYLYKYKDPINSALLFFIPPISVLVQFLIASNTSRENFSTTRNINLLQSVGRLAILPSTMIAGVRGWVIGQLISVAVMFFRKDLHICLKQQLAGAKINWRLIVENFPEAIHLGLITTLWMQLLSSARVFASFMYPDTVIAQYGLAGTAYQVVASLMIAAFIPQTIKTYKLWEEDRASAVNYVLWTIITALPLMGGMVVMGCLIAPWFFEYFFPNYQIDFHLSTPLIVCLIGYPVIVTVGALLIGAKRPILYLGVIVTWCLIDWMLASKGESYFGYNSAAIAQLISLSMYAITLLSLVRFAFSDLIRYKWHLYIPISVIGSAMALCLYIIW